MGERVFWLEVPMSGLHEQMTVCAADLAERIVDEISESDQDWRIIEQHARELVELLALHNPRPQASSHAGQA
jgi:hypothetical protein